MVMIRKKEKKIMMVIIMIITKTIKIIIVSNHSLKERGVLLLQSRIKEKKCC